MSKAFDPTPYIEAERARRAAVAAGCDKVCYAAGATKMAENRHSFASDTESRPPVAGVAGVAAPYAETRPWTLGLVALRAMPKPEWRTPGHWRRLLNDCERLDRNWGRVAHAFGWSSCDLFGSPVDPYSPAVGQLGLALLLDGRDVLAMTARTATIANRRGPPNTFQLYPWRRPGVPVWIAYSPAAGP